MLIDMGTKGFRWKTFDLTCSEHLSLIGNSAPPLEKLVCRRHFSIAFFHPYSRQWSYILSSAKSPLSKLSLEKRKSKIGQEMAKLCSLKDTLSFSAGLFKEKDRMSLKLDNFAVSYPILLFLFSSESLDKELFPELKICEHSSEEGWEKSNWNVSSTG